MRLVSHRLTLVALIGLFSTISDVCSNRAYAQFMAVQAQQQDWIAMWAFNGRSEKDVQRQLKFDYRMRIKIIDRLCTLNDIQETKLTTAAEADLTRFFRDVAKIRRKVDGMDIGQNNRNINERWQVISPLQTKMQQGIFSDKSLFQKVLRSSLGEEQHALYKADLEKSRRRRWRTMTRANVADIEKSMPLLADQREKLLALLDAQKLPMKIQKRMDGYAGFLKLLTIKNRDKQLAEFLDEDQVEVIDQYCQRYRGWEGMLR